MFLTATLTTVFTFAKMLTKGFIEEKNMKADFVFRVRKMPQIHIFVLMRYHGLLSNKRSIPQGLFLKEKDELWWSQVIYHMADKIFNGFREK